MISLPPVITDDNNAYALAFLPIKDKVKELTLSIIKKECYLEFDNKGFASLQKYMAAMLFGQLIRSMTQNPYIEDIEETTNKYKEQIDYDEFKKCFSCSGINIDDIVENFGYIDDP